MGAIADNLERVRDRIAAAAGRAGRDPSAVTLVAVTKNVPPPTVEDAIAAGQLVFGENRVQEAKAKIPQVSGRARWQMVGHLQSNKAREAVALFELIQSVDTLKLARELQKWADRDGQQQGILLEVNVAGEANKFGLKPEDAPATLEQINQFPRLEVRGLMTIAPFLEDPDKVRPYFRKLRELRGQLGLTELSMGMSRDFEVAIEEGATMVRVGTAVFGERPRRETGAENAD